MRKIMHLIALCFLYLATTVGFVSTGHAGAPGAMALDQVLSAEGYLVVDIRTKPEWQSTGVVPGSLPLTFFQADGSYDADGFLSDLSQHAGKVDRVAVLCRSGNRSTHVSRFLVSMGYEDVVNVVGGVRQGLQKGVKLVPYSESE